MTGSKSDVDPGMMPAWLILVDADGYQPFISRDYAYEEGDQQLQIRLKHGLLTGRVVGPNLDQDEPIGTFTAEAR